MERHLRLRELLIGIEGLALLRNLYDGSDEDGERRLAEVERLLGDEALLSGEKVREVSPRAGYQAWSESYDEPGNPIIEREQPAVWSLVDSLPPGRALDAACGTGRHSRHLVERGHEVVGFDLSPEMLARAAESVPEARFMEADLRSAPAADGEFDLVVCGLALAHLDDLSEGVAELARALAPGGHLIVSVLHPFLAQLGWQAPFTDASGERGFVREHPHTHADHLEAFRSANLVPRGCLEPALTEAEVSTKRRAFRHVPEATIQAYVGLPAVLVWSAEKAPR